jgi:hypothetical protein
MPQSIFKNYVNYVKNSNLMPSAFMKSTYGAVILGEGSVVHLIQVGFAVYGVWFPVLALMKLSRDFISRRILLQ